MRIQSRRRLSSAFFGVMLFFVISLSFVCAVSNADDGHSLVFPDKRKFLAPPGDICTYIEKDGSKIKAACGQVLITFRTFHLAMVKPILRILKDHKAVRIGQIPSDGIIQVKVPDKQVIKLRDDIEDLLKKLGITGGGVVVTLNFALDIQDPK